MSEVKDSLDLNNKGEEVVTLGGSSVEVVVIVEVGVEWVLFGGVDTQARECDLSLLQNQLEHDSGRIAISKYAQCSGVLGQNWILILLLLLLLVVQRGCS